MQNNQINIFDKEGNVIGIKPKSEIDKIADILEVVYAKVFVGDGILLSKIIQKPDGLKKVYEGKWGAPVATIMRVGESTEDAFKRASLDDLGVIPEIVQKHPRVMQEFANGSIRHVHAFEAKLDVLPARTETDFKIVTMQELRELIEAGTVAETLAKLF